VSAILSSEPLGQKFGFRLKAASQVPMTSNFRPSGSELNIALTYSSLTNLLHMFIIVLSL